VSTSAVSNPPRRSRGAIWALAVLGAVVGALLVVSGAAATIHADRDHQSPYQFTVSIFGAPVHQSAVATTDELRPRMRAWGYGLAAGLRPVAVFSGRPSGGAGVASPGGATDAAPDSRPVIPSH
jgi:hypothetical protein